MLFLNAPSRHFDSIGAFRILLELLLKETSQQFSFFNVNQWFSTFSLNGDESRLTSLLEGRTKAFTTSQFTRFVLLQNEVCYRKYQRFYRKTIEGRTKGAWELHATLRTVIEKHWCRPSLRKKK